MLDKSDKGLEKMTGLAGVKEVIVRRMRSREAQQARIRQGRTSSPIRLHRVFNSNPGTGKTTVARRGG